MTALPITQQPRSSEYASFRILIDDPAEDPALGFPDYADAFAEIIRLSPPRFAVGIFGSWGSGKTTLMRAIEARIEGHEEVIPVWFNAWRYEREEHLIIPLLDVLREALLEWAETNTEQANSAIIGRARHAASAMGAAARAIATGISFSAGVPGGIAEARLDLEKVLANKTPGLRADEAVSLYHASFTTMADAVREFITAGGRRRRGDTQPQPHRRIVVFIDDLDRCLPLNALTVLESMKLFFDLDGFVFVAGLDQQVIERAIEIRYADPRERSANGSSAPTNGSNPSGDRAKSMAAPSGAPVSGRDYIKKIFQVPFGLPAVDRSLLPELVSKLVQARKLERAQKNDLTGRILNHLRYFSDQAGVNPREVKRLINAYTLQAKLMSLKLPRTDPGAKVDLDTILALQVIAFRPDWERIWRRLEADPDGFVGRLNDAIRQGAKGDPVWVDGEPLPPRLVDYVTAGPAKPLLTNKRLKAYLFNSQTSHSSDPLILQAQAIVDDLRRFTQDIGESTDRRRLSEVLHSRLDALKSTMAGATWARDLVPLASWLEREASTLAPTGEDAPHVPLDQWADGFRARLDRLENDLRELRDRYSLRAT